jgi:hypothetical protein
LARARYFRSGRTETPGHIVVLAEYARRHVCGAGRYRRELKQPSGIFLEGDSARGGFLDGAGDLIDGLGEVPILHANDRFTGLLDPFQDLLVLDLEFGIALGLFAYLLPVGVVLPGVGSDIGQDGHLVNVGIVLGVDSFEFRMEGFVAGAGESGISFRHLEEGISFMEVGVVIISW